MIENVGGRLRLRYVGLEDTESYDQWLFYLDYRLRPVGWCQENKYRMDPPSGKGQGFCCCELCQKTVSSVPGCVPRKFMSSAASCTSERVIIKHLNFRICAIENKTQDLNCKCSKRGRLWGGGCGEVELDPLESWVQKCKALRVRVDGDMVTCSLFL